MKIIQYFPNFFDVGEEDIAKEEFNSLEELLKIKFIKRKIEDPKFKRLYISRNILMVEYNNKFSDKEGNKFPLGWLRDVNKEKLDSFNFDSFKESNEN